MTHVLVYASMINSLEYLHAFLWVPAGVAIRITQVVAVRISKVKLTWNRVGLKTTGPPSRFIRAVGLCQGQSLMLIAYVGFG